MSRPEPYLMTQEEFDADQKRAYALSQTAPVELIDSNGKARMVISCGRYINENDCVWCDDTKMNCDKLDLGTCAGPVLRRAEVRVAELTALIRDVHREASVVGGLLDAAARLDRIFGMTSKVVGEKP